MPLITGEARFAYLFRPDTKFKPKYAIDVVISKKEYDELAATGVKGLSIKDGEHIAKFKTTAFWPDGSPKRHPRVVGPDGRTDFTQEVGNGSTVTVAYKIHEYEGFGGGTTLVLEQVRVDKHVPYERSDNPFDTGDEGDEPTTEDDNPFK